jgi:hypothetical protein
MSKSCIAAPVAVAIVRISPPQGRGQLEGLPKGHAHVGGIFSPGVAAVLGTTILSISYENVEKY